MYCTADNKTCKAKIIKAILYPTIYTNYVIIMLAASFGNVLSFYLNMFPVVVCSVLYLT